MSGLSTITAPAAPAASAALTPPARGLDRMSAAHARPARNDVAFANVLRDAGGTIAIESADQNAALAHAVRGGVAMEDATAPLPLPKNEAISLRAMPARPADELRTSARQLVASALLMPVLEQMNASPLRPTDGPFAATTVEKRFGPLLHQHIADRMMQSRSFGLVDAVVERMGGGRTEITE